MMRPKLKQYIAIVGFLGFAGTFTACDNGKKAPDVSNIKVTLDTRRLDHDLFRIDTNNISGGLQQLQQKYPDFLNFYLDTLMAFNIHGNFSDTTSAIRDGLKTFLSFKDYRDLFDTVNKHFPDTKMIDGELTKGFQYLKYYYPKCSIPKVVYFTSALNNWSAITYDSIVGIGLDMYLGPQYPFYTSVGIPAYATAHFLPEYASVNVMTAIYYNMHPFVVEGRNLLDLMIQRGKQEYFVEKILPFTEDSVRFGFSKSQLDWALANESDVYNFFLKENLFYETNMQKIVRYVNDAPSATGMPPQSPGNIGTWLGCRIVKAYMEQHPDMTMQQLFEIKDAQRILQESKYKPK